MARGSQVGRKINDRRKAGSTYRASDQSDEDYTVDDDEEFDESGDGYSSFVGDDSEESLGEYEDEEEELKTRKVKRVVRSRAPSRNGKGTVKPRKRKRVSYREDDDDDNDGVDEDDEEFKPDCLDEEEEFPVTKGTNNISKRQLHKATVKDEDDEDFTPDCLDEEDDNDEEEESPVMEGTDSSSKRWLHKGTVKDEDDEEDEELNPDDLHEEEGFPVMKGMKNSSRLRGCKATAKDDDEDDDVVDEDDDEEDKDDEEFTPDGMDEEEDIPVTKGMNSSKPRLCKGTTNDDYEDEDDDDEEFTPDDLDEEEEFPEMEGIKYSAKPRLRKGTAREQKRNKNHKELRKITRKKPLKRCRLRRKARSENDEEFIDVDPITKEKNKKKADQRRKRKRLTVDPDSDFVASSGSSEHEFTISEEEREQVREASNFCRSLVTTWRGSTSLKKSPREEAPRLQRPARKAKEKMEEFKIEAGKQICGICLSEEGKRTVRGTLNCCSHYFCFACIMEWSKVESRCPLCKQRFVTISKPARSDTGFDLRTVAIQVPERDQVYQPSEEELRGYLDPYENVLCTECQQGGDDALMLLCDLCDSPAHTYCVGLGHEVPEGNWYCESCRPTALASSNPHNLNPIPDNRTSGSFSVGSPPVANVRETFDLNEMYVPDTPLTEESGDFQSPRDGQVSSLASGIGAFTVSDRRRIQRQIHQLLNNRRRQLGNITGTLGAVSGNSIFGSQIARSRELATQPAIAPRAAQN